MARENVTVPKVIRWEDIVLPDKWIMDRATPTLPRKTPEIQQIRQFETGKVEIVFDRRNSFSSRSEASGMPDFASARRSFSVASQSGVSQSIHPPPEINFRGIPPELNLRGIDTTSTIPRTAYHKDEEEDQRSIQSPTYSSLNDNYDVNS
ncbi:Enzymatic polyprotein [Sesbania bispinosa]|nr:Enzymatic polyprotein [Sesbania bispinosa]